MVAGNESGECFQSSLAPKGDAVSLEEIRTRRIDRPVGWQERNCGLKVKTEKAQAKTKSGGRRVREREKRVAGTNVSLLLHLRRNYERQGWVAQTGDGRDSWKCRGIG